MADHTYLHAKLQDDLKKAHEELKEKQEEVLNLSKVRDRVGVELEELTACLFTEAHKMVKEANEEKAAAEKREKESQCRIEALEVEVAALKKLLTANALLPKPDSGQFSAMQKLLKSTKGHKRSGSHSDVMEKKSELNHSSLFSENNPVDTEKFEIDPVLYDEFRSWRAVPAIEAPTSNFLSRIYEEEITPCLTYRNTQLSKELQQCVEDNAVTLENVNGRSDCEQHCTLMQTKSPCTYRMNLGESSVWYPISRLARDRIASVCDFLTYVRYVQKGLVKQEDKVVFAEIVRLRRNMSLAKLGFLSCYN